MRIIDCIFVKGVKQLFNTDILVLYYSITVIIIFFSILYAGSFEYLYLGCYMYEQTVNFVILTCHIGMKVL